VANHGGERSPFSDKQGVAWVWAARGTGAQKGGGRAVLGFYQGAGARPSTGDREGGSGLKSGGGTKTATQKELSVVGPMQGGQGVV